jgi:hypothetical protein
MLKTIIRSALVGVFILGSVGAAGEVVFVDVPYDVTNQSVVATGGVSGAGNPIEVTWGESSEGWVWANESIIATDGTGGIAWTHSSSFTGTGNGYGGSITSIHGIVLSVPDFGLPTTPVLFLMEEVSKEVTGGGVFTARCSVLFNQVTSASLGADLSLPEGGYSIIDEYQDPPQVTASQQFFIAGDTLAFRMTCRFTPSIWNNTTGSASINTTYRLVARAIDSGRPGRGRGPQ